MRSTGVNGHLRRGSIIRIGSVALAAVLTAVGLLTAHGASGAVAAGTTAYVPPVKHVFIINIENKGYDATWGPTSAAPYLAKTLRWKGVLLDTSRGSGPRVVSFGGSVLLVKTATATPGGWWRRTSR